MPIISVQSLYKAFSIPKHRKGLWNGLVGLLSKDHDLRVALDLVSFEIQEGELVGYIGPNGAGKSTTVKTLSGILVPGSGEVNVLGKTPWKHRIETVRNIGVVFGQKTQLWWDLQVVESFKLLKDIYGISDGDYRRTLDPLVEALELTPLLSVPVRLLSLGQRMRCDLAASLLHRPKILFLDEPTIGLDAVSKLAVRDFIRHLNKEHRITILLTTHDMDDIEALCHRVLVLDRGKIYFDGALAGLRKKILPERYLVMDLVEENCQVEESMAECFKREGHRVWMRFNPQVVSAHELIARMASKYPIADLFVENPPIEEIIARFYRGNR